eukprot:5842851-Karenia_brevis.AAC.1
MISVKKIPVERRWIEDSVRRVKWAPSRKYTDAEDADGDVPERATDMERAKEKEDGAIPKGQSSSSSG